MFELKACTAPSWTTLTAPHLTGRLQTQRPAGATVDIRTSHGSVMWFFLFFLCQAARRSSVGLAVATRVASSGECRVDDIGDAAFECAPGFGFAVAGGDAAGQVGVGIGAPPALCGRDAVDRGRPIAGCRFVLAGSVSLSPGVGQGSPCWRCVCSRSEASRSFALPGAARQQQGEAIRHRRQGVDSCAGKPGRRPAAAAGANRWTSTTTWLPPSRYP